MAKILILDDEPDGASVLKTIIEKYCPHMEVVDTCTHPKTALQSVQQHKPDILLVDIEMPYMSGIEFVKCLPNRENYIVIFVTAYDNHAIEAIKLNSFDYILKPVQKEEMIASLNKAFEQLKTKNSDPQQANTKLGIPTAEGIHFIQTSKILYLQSEGNYTIVQLLNRERIVSTKGLKEFESILPKNFFLRIHQSFIVNFEHVIQFLRNDGGYLLLTENVSIPISRRKKDEFFEFIKQNQIGIR
jgi:two-component system LytT family response regulator